MKRKIALLASFVLSLQIAVSAFVPVAAKEELGMPVKAEVPSIKHEKNDDNLFPDGNLDNKDAAIAAFSGTSDKPTRKWVEDDNGGYIESGRFPNEYTGLKYNPGVEIPAGTYKLTLNVRTLYEGHKSRIIIMVYGKDGQSAEHVDGQIKNWFNVGIGNKWQEITYYFTLKSPLNYIVIRPTTSPTTATTPICVDEISLVPTKRVPGDQKYLSGINVTNDDLQASYDSCELIEGFNMFPKWDPNEDYEIEGLMLNLDNTSHGVSGSVTEESLVNWVNQYKGTHVTDMVMNIAESKCVYPTDVFFGWYGDGQTRNTDGVITTDPRSDSNGYVQHFITNKMDYLKTLSKELPKAGINMWMSIRMNDAHDRNAAESTLFTEYFFNHPEYRRDQYGTQVTTYYAKIWDYSYPEIRNIYLALLNESLDRYDVYGYQFEWQREMWLFHPGGEYAGIDILNQFMRDADAIISIYEEKYGHEIKFAVTCGADLQTNYDFGLDIMTWVSEGILDMVSPMGRWSTTYNETPVALWKTLMEPYGVEVSPCIEHGISHSPLKKSHDFPNIEHYTGTAALFLSQGADKLQIYNILVPLSHVFKDSDKVVAYDVTREIPETPGSKTQPMWWVLLTSIGSYEKLMTLNRTVLPTWNDTNQVWRSNSTTSQFPITCRVGYSSALRIGMGDVPEGAKVTVAIAPNAAATAEKAPTVYVNTELCTFVGTKNIQDPDRTEYDMWVFEVPESVHDDMFAVVEIVATARPGFGVDYAEIRIEPAAK